MSTDKHSSSAVKVHFLNYSSVCFGQTRNYAINFSCLQQRPQGKLLMLFDKHHKTIHLFLKYPKETTQNREDLSPNPPKAP